MGMNAGLHSLLPVGFFGQTLIRLSHAHVELRNGATLGWCTLSHLGWGLHALLGSMG